MTNVHINEIIGVLETVQMTRRQTQVIRNITREHTGLRSKNPKALYGIKGLTERNLIGLYKILLEHKYEILCGECGKRIRYPHQIAIGAAGLKDGNDMESLGPVHKGCKGKRSGRDYYADYKFTTTYIAKSPMCRRTTESHDHPIIDKGYHRRSILRHKCPARQAKYSGNGWNIINETRTRAQKNTR
ncbi:MAG: hypothetical protein LBQ49_00930 [Rickettsiales bacterium]|jgi:hypothetical protein|nr:hypothetical protein [Rickettsiales bacterium]